MYVVPNWRGQGIGRRLLEEVVRLAEKLPSLQRVLLSVSATPSTARHLYASLGFRAFGTEPQALQVDDRFIDEDHMALTLKNAEDRA